MSRAMRPIVMMKVSLEEEHDQPEGFIKEGKENHVLKLKKSLYELKKAPRAWNYKVDDTLNYMCFIKSVSDQAVYTSCSKEHRLLVGVYVDDLIIVGSHIEEIEVFHIRECNSSKSPMECRIKLNREGKGAEVEPTHFIKLIECLRYLTVTRPDLVFLVSYLS